jgi:hypothetical protein
MTVTYLYANCICCGMIIAPPYDYDPEVHTLYCSETCKVTVRVLDHIYSQIEEVQDGEET